MPTQIDGCRACVRAGGSMGEKAGKQASGPTGRPVGRQAGLAVGQSASQEANTARQGGLTGGPAGGRDGRPPAGKWASGPAYQRSTGWLATCRLAGWSAGTAAGRPRKNAVQQKKAALQLFGKTASDPKTAVQFFENYNTKTQNAKTALQFPEKNCGAATARCSAFFAAQRPRAAVHF